MPRCPNGTRRNHKSGNCEQHNKKSSNSTTKKSRSKAPVDTPAPVKPPYTFIEFCRICSELYGVSYTFFYKHGGDTRTLYYVYNRNRSKFVFPKSLKTIMIGTPSDKFITRTPYTGKAIKNKNGVSANVVLKDITRSELNGIKSN